MDNCGETSAPKIHQKFRKYGKMKDTFRGSNLAKQSVHELYMSYLDISNPNLTKFRSEGAQIGQNFQYLTAIFCCQEKFLDLKNFKF